MSHMLRRQFRHRSSSIEFRFHRSISSNRGSARSIIIIIDKRRWHSFHFLALHSSSSVSATPDSNYEEADEASGGDGPDDDACDGAGGQR